MDDERERFPWPTANWEKLSRPIQKRKAAPWLFALGCVAATTVVAIAIEPYATFEDEAMIYLLGDTLAALYFDTKTSLATAVGSILACDFFFVPPRMEFAWTDARKLLTFLAMLVVAAVISKLSERLRHQAQAATRAAGATKTLYELHVALTGGEDPRQMAAVTRRRLQRLFGGEVSILLRSPQGKLETARAELTAAELTLAEQAFGDRDFSSGSLGIGYATWLPVIGIREPLAVIGLKLAAPFEQDSEQGLLLSACARELGTALERTQLAKVAQRAQVDAETERMRSSLVSAVSHDLKTPLASIVASGTTLLEHEGTLDAGVSRSLLSTIVREGERLGSLLQNLLSVSRLESPTIELRRTPEALEDIVAVALSRLDDALASRHVDVDLPSELPYVLIEPALIEQVLLNLLENALRHTPPSANIEVSAYADQGVVKVQVSDDGPGIPEAEREKVFEKFIRGSRAVRGDGGVGLGLTICRAVVRAHGGKIAVFERAGGGTLVEFTLPINPAATAWPEPLREVSA